MIPIIGPLISMIGSAAGGAAGVAGSLAGSALSGAGSLAGSAIGGVGSLAGNIAELGGSLAYNTGYTLSEVGTAAIEGAGGLIESAGEFMTGLPELGESVKPIADVVGSVYGAFTSLEQAKAARVAAEKYGRNVNLPVGNVPIVVQSPSPAAAIPTINLTAGGGPAMTEEERLYREAVAQSQGDSEKFVMYMIIALGVYLILQNV